MKKEVSAGGVVARDRRGWQVLVVRDMNDMLTFPKGLIEPNEEPLEAAKREIREEVGVTNLRYVDDLPQVRYVYKRGSYIEKTVKYYLFISAGNEVLAPQVEEGLHDAAWMPISTALTKIGYPKSNLPLLENALWKLKMHRT